MALNVDKIKKAVETAKDIGKTDTSKPLTVKEDFKQEVKSKLPPKPEASFGKEKPAPTTRKQVEENRKDKRKKELEKQVSISREELWDSYREVLPPADFDVTAEEKLGRILLEKTIRFTISNKDVLARIALTLGANKDTILELIRPEDFESKCPDGETLRLILDSRDNLVSMLNQLGDYFEQVDRLGNLLDKFLQGQIDTITASKTLESINSGLAKVIPSPPGVPGFIVSLMSDLKGFISTLTFDVLGNSKLQKYKTAVTVIQYTIQSASSVLQQILKPLDVIDAKLRACNATGKPVNTNVKFLGSIYQPTGPTSNVEAYQGFTLEIVEVPFTNTVTRRKAVAKNPYGIVMLETPLSFTTINQVLFDQLKYEIIRNNLKPY